MTLPCILFICGLAGLFTWMLMRPCDFVGHRGERTSLGAWVQGRGFTWKRHAAEGPVVCAVCQRNLTFAAVWLYSNVYFTVRGVERLPHIDPEYKEKTRITPVV
jgi:hypothetical protein